MTHDQLALLKTFAARPARTIQPSVQALFDELRKAGYVACSTEGWIATADGCNAIEQERANSLARSRI
jgi:hypothetical protein